MTADGGAGRTARRQAIAWLAHPATIAAGLVLALNDHVLKAEFGTWWTGKLSDVAGLVLAPALLAVVVSLLAPRIPTRSLLPATLAAVGIGFAVVKMTAVGAAAASAGWTAVAGPSVILRDPTDLFAIPALAVAWAIARRTAGGRAESSRQQPEAAARRQRAGAILRWGVVLPLALLATTATSPADDDQSAEEIAVVHSVLIAGNDRGSWSTSTDGLAWTQLRADRWAIQADLVDGAGGTLTSTCVEWLDTCFRAVPGRLAVEVSMDGGETWEIDWEIPDDTRAALADQFVGGSPDRLQTEGVAILPTPGGYRVYAANGMDGFAVRDEDGSWERVGFTFFTASPEPPRPLPRVGDTHSVRWAWFLGVVGATFALCVFSVAAPSSRSLRARRYVGAAAAAAMGLAAFAFAIALNASFAGGPPNGFFHFLPEFVVGPILAGSAVLFALAGLAAGRVRDTAYGHAAIVGLAAGVATAITPGHLLIGFAVGAMVALVGTALASRRQSRARERAPEPDPEPNPYAAP